LTFVEKEIDMTALKNFFKQIFSKDRRKAERLPAQELAAFFWTGAAPVEHRIRDISSTGLYLLTDERWYLGTLVKMTLQKRDDGVSYSERAIAVQSKAVRWGEDGVGLEFVVPDSRNRGQNTGYDGVDRKGLEKFLADFRAENGFATVLDVKPQPHTPLDPGTAKP
jgi:hypothetical protein